MPPRGRASKSSAPEFGPDTRICVLHGPDDMQKRLHLQALREALEKAHGAIEQHQYDGKSATLADVLDELRSYSLMQTYKLVLLDQAEEFVKTHRAALERYAAEPVDHATLVMRADTWYKGNLDKQIAKVGAMVECKEPGPEQARRWLVERAEQVHHCTLTPDAATLLVDRLGTDQLMLDTEVGKLALMVEPGAPITPELVQRSVGRGNEEQAWVMQEAVLAGLAQRSAAPMLRKMHELVDLGGQPDVLVAYFVIDLVRKLNVAMQMRQAGIPQAQVLRELKIWGERQRPFTAALSRLDPRRAATLFDQAVTADAHSKSGRGEVMRNLEAFCVRLADEVQ